ncbi:MAG: histidine kinase [Flavobacteriales bacterium]|nr:histidine kinase [Flavobacteriales bacterium]
MLASMAGTGLRTIREWRKLKTERDALSWNVQGASLPRCSARDPHYLFNSLNTICARTSPGSAHCGRCIAVEHPDALCAHRWWQDRVPLEQEVEHMKAYMDFQHLRSGAHVQADLRTNGDLSGSRSTPLLLQPFVENAYSTASARHELSPIRVELDVIRGLGDLPRFEPDPPRTVSGRINGQWAIQCPAAIGIDVSRQTYAGHTYRERLASR